MRQPLRTTLLFVAALFMVFAAFVNAFIGLPHLHEDMLEIAVRPTLLNTVMLGLYFGTLAMFAFACLVFVATFESSRGVRTMRLPLWIVAVTYLVFGVLAFVWSGSHHSLGYALAGVLILLAVNIRESR